jgi:dGTPase
MVKHESEYDVSDSREFSPELRGNFETQICNVADELAYTTHDLDDGLRSGMITPQMLEDISLWDILTKKYNWSGSILADVERHRMIRDLVGLQVTDMIQSTDKRILDRKAKSALDIPKLFYNILGYSEDMLLQNRELKDFLFN